MVPSARPGNVPGAKGLILLALLANALGSAPARADWNRAALLQALSARPAAEAHFSETRTSALLKEPLHLQGVLRYRKPAFLEKRVLTPFRETLTVEGERMTWEQTDAGRKRTASLRDYPAAWGFIESLRATLNGDGATLERFYKVRLEGDEARWNLVLLPSDPDMARFIRVVRIAGKGAGIRTVEIQETEGDRSLMTLEEKR